jgi:hypothetical protein
LENYRKNVLRCTYICKNFVGIVFGEVQPEVTNLLYENGAPHNLVDTDQCFRGAYYLHPDDEGRKNL